jgi:hypothetical protein
MPNCFQLLRAGVAVPLHAVDEEMCRHFEAPCDPDYFFEGWYGTIGFDLAKGDSFAVIRATYAAHPALVQVADWLEANFTVRSWYELKSHPKDPRVQ